MEWRVTTSAVFGITLLVGHNLAYRASAEMMEIKIEDKVAGFDLPSENGGSPQVLFLVYTDRGVFNVGWEPLDVAPAI